MQVAVQAIKLTMGERHALLVSNSDLADSALAGLPASTLDLDTLESVLSDPAAGDFQVTRLLDANVQQLRERIVRLYRGQDADDILLLIYGGHLLQDRFGELYLAAGDTDTEVLDATGIRVGFLRDQLDKSRSTKKIVLLNSATTAVFPGSRELVGGASGIIAALEGDRRGRMVVAASDVVGAALDGDASYGEPAIGRLGELLSEGLSAGKADLDGNGEINAEELYDFIYQTSLSRHPTGPIPRKFSSPGMRQCLISRNPRFQPMELPAELKEALASQHPWMREGAIGELERLLTTQADESLSHAAHDALKLLSADKTPQIAKSATAILRAHSESQQAGGKRESGLEGSSSPSAPVESESFLSRLGIPVWGWVASGVIALFAIGFAAGLAGLFEDRQPEQELAPTDPPAATSLPISTSVPATATESAALVLTEVPEERLPSSIGMITIPAGTYPIGTDRAISVASYWIDRFEVTNTEYSAYLTENELPMPRYWLEEDIPSEKADHPVRSITWDLAVDYCRWLEKRLPTEAEWEIAARGPQGLLYPWGNDASALDLPSSGSYPAGAFPTNRSFYGAFDMAANVWEWVDLPYIPIPEGQRLLKGGANNFQNDMAYRLPGDQSTSTTISQAGFRCAAPQVEIHIDPALILTDEFDNILSGWYQAAEPVREYFFGYHPSDFYHVQVSAPDSCLGVRHELKLTNFIVDVEIFQARTDTETGDFRHGLLIRGEGADFYSFMISPRSQSWHIVKNGPAEGLVLNQGTHSSIQGQTRDDRDRLTVIANGAELSFMVNGHLVSRVFDESYSEGNLGFIVQTLEETYAHIHFDRVFVWKLPSGTGQMTDIPEQETILGRTIVPACTGSITGDGLLNEFITYSVKEGDTLSEIARFFGLTLAEVKGANGRRVEDPNVIRVGQILIIPEQ
jgi:formylglycine-generating enzyme required for sulfatase activity